MPKMTQKDLNTELSIAILRKPFDKAELLKWYDKGANVYGATKYSTFVPLLEAFHQNVEALELLLQNGASLNVLLPPFYRTGILHRAAYVAELSNEDQQRLELLLQYDWNDAFHTLLSSHGLAPYDLLRPKLKVYYDENQVPLNKKVQQHLLEASILKSKLALGEDTSWKGWWLRLGSSLWASQETPQGAGPPSSTTSAFTTSTASATGHLSATPAVDRRQGESNGLRRRRPIHSSEATNEEVELRTLGNSFH